MIDAAGMVVVTAVPFGLGNLRNLEAAKEALKRGIPTYIVDEVPIERRDFTGGKAVQLMSELRQAGAVFVKNPADLPSLLNLSKTKHVVLSEKAALTGHVKGPLKCTHKSLESQRDEKNQ